MEGAQGRAWSLTRPGSVQAPGICHRRLTSWRWTSLELWAASGVLGWLALGSGQEPCLNHKGWPEAGGPWLADCLCSQGGELRGWCTLKSCVLRCPWSSPGVSGREVWTKREAEVLGSEPPDLPLVLGKNQSSRFRKRVLMNKRISEK